MLTVQANLFDSKPTYQADWIGSGCYGRVWAHPDGESVIKRALSDDGTLAYIYWCYEMQKGGQMMRGMPEVYSLVLTEGAGWIATMKLYDTKCDDYDSTNPGYSAFDNRDELPYVQLLLAAYREAVDNAGFTRTKAGWSHTEGDPIDGYALTGDLHSGNWMWDSKESTLVLLDPSGVEIDRSQLWGLLPKPVGEFVLEMQ